MCLETDFRALPVTNLFSFHQMWLMQNVPTLISLCLLLAGLLGSLLDTLTPWPLCPDCLCPAAHGLDWQAWQQHNEAVGWNYSALTCLSWAEVVCSTPRKDLRRNMLKDFNFDNLSFYKQEKEYLDILRRPASTSRTISMRSAPSLTKLSSPY